ncbi:hypothetical protein ELK40_00710 (plasmid) [Enterobacter sp. N18-03635]|nr:hypothetical protein ELK40_00710 [Enterobacter sp. N18-03635]
MLQSTLSITDEGNTVFHVFCERLCLYGSCIENHRKWLSELPRIIQAEPLNCHSLFSQHIELLLVTFFPVKHGLSSRLLNQQHRGSTLLGRKPYIHYISREVYTLLRNQNRRINSIPITA